MSKDLGQAENSSVPKNVEIRELQVQDLDQLLVVRRRSFEEFGPWYSKPDAEAFKNRMRNRIGRDDVRVDVATISNSVIGYVLCSIDETKRETGTIRNISVLPEHRRKHIGTALMASAFSFLRKNNVKTVDTVTETAEEFYRKVGFRVDARFVRVRKWLSKRATERTSK
jgi:ribosomal protein S18 acetylase RimI-like enzyme